MRFNPDEPREETRVRWYFTKPDAKWCGLPNVFNSRNWYKGVPNWPLLGEVEGAARPWDDGHPCPGEDGPHGTADQWLYGSPVSLFPPLCSCVCPTCMVAADEFGFVQHQGGPVMQFQFGLPLFAAQDSIHPAVWWTDYVSDSFCAALGFAMDLWLTGPPPDFAKIVQLKLVSNNFQHNAGAWKVPLSSPYFPGEVVTVASD
jgi:hypothetical protein